MYQGVTEYVDSIFKRSPSLAASPELKAEFIKIINNRISEYINDGLDFNAAFEKALSNFENVSTTTPTPTTDRRGSAYFDINHLSGALWLLGIAFYVLFSFVTDTWAWSWTIILVMSALQTLVVDFHKHGKITRNGFTGAFWVCVTAFYFLFSFWTGAWAWSWVIFIIGAAFTTLMYGYKRY